MASLMPVYLDVPCMSCERRLQVRCGGSSQLPDPGPPPSKHKSTKVERLFRRWTGSIGSPRRQATPLPTVSFQHTM